MIFIIGGTGILGSELKKLNNNIVCVNSEYDIYDFVKLKEKLDLENPDIIINCCSIKSEIKKDPKLSINVNIIGSCNISKYCIDNKKRLVYISTDYVYPGNGNHSETDSLNPHNIYAWTKLSGEVPVRLVEDHLIIRTSFGKDIFDHSVAYENLYTSKDYVDVIAPMILKAVESNITGVINIGTERKSIYEYANRRNNIKSSKINIGKDFSLNTKLYNEL